MPAIINRRIKRKKRVISGHGIRDDIVEFGKSGVRYLKSSAVNGLKGLVPIAANYASSLASDGLRYASDAAASKAASVMHNMSDALQDKIIERTGGSISRPGRHLMLREINQALSRTSIRRH